MCLICRACEGCLHICPHLPTSHPHRTPVFRPGPARCPAPGCYPRPRRSGARSAETPGSRRGTAPPGTAGPESADFSAVRETGLGAGSQSWSGEPEWLFGGGRTRKPQVMFRSMLSCSRDDHMAQAKVCFPASQPWSRSPFNSAEMLCRLLWFTMSFQHPSTPWTPKVTQFPPSSDLISNLMFASFVAPVLPIPFY